MNGNWFTICFFTFCVSAGLKLKILYKQSLMRKDAYDRIWFQGLILAARAEFSAEDCSALGFSKANLLCSSCDTLADFGLQELK